MTPQLGRFYFNALTSLEIVECDFNVVGLPLYKSSRMCDVCVDYYGAVIGQKNIPPFVFAIYKGPSHHIRILRISF